MHKPILLSIVCALGAACQGAAASSSPGHLGATASLPSPKPILEPGDFRSRFVEVAKRVSPAVVTVTATQQVDVPAPPFGEGGTPFEFFFRPRGPRAQGLDAEPHKQERIGTGSGIIVREDGTILTNNHVVADAERLKVVLYDDRELPAKVVGTDSKTDIAVIRIDPEALKGEKLPRVALGESGALQVGEWVMAIGAPFGLKQTVSAGIVLSQFFNGFTVRSDRLSIFQVGFLSNPRLVVAECFGVAFMCAISYAPPLQAIFNTAPLALTDWALLATVGSLVLVADEARKAVLRHRDRHKEVIA